METLNAEFTNSQQTALAQRPQMAMTGLEVGVSTALEAQVRASIEARYELALRRPRDLDMVRQKIIKECNRPGLADVAMYSKPIGGGKVTGLTIRFAEMAQRNMSNIAADSMVVYEDRTQRIVRMTVTDVEANVPLSVDIPINKTVERNSNKDREVLGVRQNKDGKTVYIVACTEDELLVKQNSLMSKAKRNLILALVPGDILDEAKRVVVATQGRTDKSDPEGQRKKVFDAFLELGITPPEIKEYLGREAGPADLPELRGLYQALKQGDVRWRDLLEEKRTGEAGDASKTLADTLAAKAAKVRPAPPSAAAVAQEAADVGLPVSVPAAPDFGKRLSEAPTRPDLERVWEDARATLVGDELDAATRTYDKRVEELRAAAGR